MTDILRLVLIIPLLTISLAAYLLVVRAVFPARVERTQIVVNQSPWRSLGLGLINFFFFGVTAFAMLSLAENTGAFVRGLLTVPALIILAFLAILLSVGLTGVVVVLGGRLFPNLPEWKQTMWGTVVLAFACALPFAGWFLLLPAVGFVGIGATILGYIQRSP